MLDKVAALDRTVSTLERLTVTDTSDYSFDSVPDGTKLSDLPLYLRKGAIITFLHDLGSALGVAIIFYYIINMLIYAFQAMSFKLYLLENVYIQPGLTKEESLKSGVVCCWGEYTKYRHYDKVQKANIDHKMSLVELLKSQRILRKLVSA